ncbi:MAG: hypothetical protein PWQ74_228 [Methanobacteriaceae archaeon]|nr:hypothetical protein [Methanobacteriaceae archaeon]
MMVKFADAEDGTVFCKLLKKDWGDHLCLDEAFGDARKIMESAGGFQVHILIECTMGDVLEVNFPLRANETFMVA